MIPEQGPVVPIAMFLALAVAFCLYAGYKAMTGASLLKPDSRPWAYVLAGSAAVLACCCAGFMAFILTTNQSSYSQAISNVLESDYGVKADDRRSIVPGESFPAALDGERVSCTVSVPDLVICDGQQLPALGSQ